MKYTLCNVNPEPFMLQLSRLCSQNIGLVYEETSVYIYFADATEHYFKNSSPTIREMTPQWLWNGCLKNLKLLKYEHIIYQFKAHDLEIPQHKFFCEIFKFLEIRAKTNFAKFLKVFIKSRKLNILQK